MDSKKLDDAMMFAQAEMEVWNKRFMADWSREAGLLRGTQSQEYFGVYGMVHPPLRSGTSPADVKEQIKTTDPEGFAGLNDVLLDSTRSRGMNRRQK